MSPLDAVPAQRLGNMSEEEFWAYAREQAGGDSVSSTPENVRASQYLECVLRQGTCLLPLAAVEEVLASPARYAILPATPHWVPGLTSWRGEVVVVVNLEAFLAEIDMPATGGLLLCAHHAELALGLFVPTIGLTITLDEEHITHPADQEEVQGKKKGAIVRGFARDVPVLDVAALLADVTRQIGMAAHYG